MKANFKHLTIALIIFVFAASCTKENPGRLLESQLLSRLPSNTIGFLIRNFDSKQSKLFKETAWGKASGETSKLLENLFGSNSEVLKDLNTNQSIEMELNKAKEVLVCLTEEEADFPLALGSLVHAQDNNSAAEVVKIVKEGLESKGHKSEAIQIADGAGHKISLKDSKIEMFLTSKGSFASVATDKELIEQLINPAEGSGSNIQTIKDSESFKKALSKVEISENSLAFSYGKVKKFIEALNKQDLSDKDKKNTKLLS